MIKIYVRVHRIRKSLSNFYKHFGRKTNNLLSFFFLIENLKIFQPTHFSSTYIPIYIRFMRCFFFYSFEIKNSVRGVIVCNERKRLLYIPISRLLGTILMEIPFFFSAPRLTVVSFIILFKTMYEKAVVEIAEIQFDSLCFENVG